eukprot:UN03865
MRGGQRKSRRLYDPIYKHESRLFVKSHKFI